MNLEMHIEAVLFYKSEPVTKKELSRLFAVPLDTIELSLVKINESLLSHGMRLVHTDTEVHMVTAPEVREIIDSVRKEELAVDIGKAGAETLAIILYRGPILRIEIDRIRGVNSNFILRNLLIRGLIERRSHPTDSRSFTYAITPALLSVLGISQKESLPEFSDIMNALDLFEKQEAEQSSEVTATNPFITS
jgi:segregation and condensation protein B